MKKPSRKVVVYSSYYTASVSYYAFILAFFPLHCKALGFSPFEISLIGAMLTAGVVLGMPSILQLAHHVFSPQRLLPCCLAIAVLSSAAMFGTKTSIALLPFWFLLTFVKRGGDSLVDAQALRDSAAAKIRFEWVRMWGSVGFILATFIIGVLIDRHGVKMILPAGTMMLSLTLLAAVPLKSFLSATPKKNDPKRPEFNKHVSISSFVLLILTYALVSASHSVLYSYLSLYLTALGWSATMVSFAWNLGVVAEVMFFLFFVKLEARLTLVQILQLSIFVSFLRWSILSMSSSASLILFSQLLHSFSFAGCYVTGLRLSHRFLPEHLKDRGQGILVSIGHGAGAFTGYILAGAGASLLSSYAQSNKLFLGSMAFSLAALLTTRFMNDSELVKESSPGNDAPAAE